MSGVVRAWIDSLYTSVLLLVSCISAGLDYGWESTKIYGNFKMRANDEEISWVNPKIRKIQFHKVIIQAKINSVNKFDRNGNLR